MGIEREPTTPPESAPESSELPDCFTSQEQYEKMVDVEARRRMADIEATKDMTPDKARTYRVSKKIEHQQAIDNTLLKITDPKKSAAFKARMAYIQSDPNAPSAIDRIKLEEAKQNRQKKGELPVPPPIPPKRKL